MRLSDLRPCDRCGGPIVRPPANWFWVVRVSGAAVTPKATEVLGLAHAAGAPLELAETLGPVRDVVLVAGDEDPELQIELLLCLACYASEFSLPDLLERHRRATSSPGPEAA